jgi:Chromo (CHRromatin Organisation MOdifier) domain
VEKAEGEDFRVRIQTSGTPYRVFPWVHISRLKPRLLHPDRPRVTMTDVPEGFDFDEALLPEDSWVSTGEYEVEELRDVRWVRNRGGRYRKEYLVKWEGYEEPTWESVHRLKCGRLLYEFDRSARAKARFAAMQTGEEGLVD